MCAPYPVSERLESRRLLTLLIVNDPGDAGDPNLSDTVIDADPAKPGEQRTLRAIIQNHNERLRINENEVRFEMGTGVASIKVGSTGLGALPSILGRLDFTGGSGSSRVELDGGMAGTNAIGLQLRGYDCVVQGLAINRFGSHGILLSGTGPPGEGGHVIKNCYIGTSLNGAADQGNGGHGILIEGGNPNNRIGGTNAADANVISGNGLDGIHVEPHLFAANPPGNTIQGNYIGTTANGAARLGNDGRGVAIDDHPNDVIGPGNVISANGLDGVLLNGSATTNIVIDGNKIGTDAAGASDFGNGINGVFVNGAPNNTIGIAGGLGNLISGNDVYGVHIAGSGASANAVRNNRIGTNAAGNAGVGNGINGLRVTDASNTKIGGIAPGSGNTIAFNGLGATKPVDGHGIVIGAGTRNEIHRNSIFSNLGRGIDLGNNSFTLNDLLDTDTGANDLQDYPVVTKVSFAGGNKTIEWALNSTPSTNFTIEFFSNDQADPSGFGEGKTYLRTRVATTNTNGTALFTEVFPATDSLISATATDNVGNTSEFSMVDTDGDALADGWETNGIDYNEDGTIDLTLASNPNHKDLFVEPDAMVGRAPTQATINGVITAFDNAPNNLVQNPDGANGVTLHATLDEVNIPLQAFPGQWAEFDPIKAARFGTPAQRANPMALAAKRLAYRYMLFADQHSGISSSGFAELPPVDPQIDPFGRNDFNVTLGHPDWVAYGVSAEIQQGTFMHELGHTLGLHHGGNDELMYKPNYHSVMNYTWQNRHNHIAGARAEFTAFRNSWTLDYSRQAFNALNENAGLNEPAGINGHVGHVLPLGVFDPGGDPVPRQFVPESGPVNWNNLGAATDVGVTRDVNGDGALNTLNGFEDWSQLRFYFQENANFADGNHTLIMGSGTAEPADEMTFENFVDLVGDVTPPTASAPAFPYTLAPHRLMFTFSEDVFATLVAADLTVQRVGGAAVPVDHITYDAPTKTATFWFAGVLPDGNYTATLAAGSVLDAAGNALADDFVFAFYVLAGDANRDRAVDFGDLVILAQNYNTTGRTFDLGDFNYDTDVDFDDLVILAQRYNTSVPAPAPAVNAVTRSAPVKRAVFATAPVTKPAPYRPARAGAFRR